MPSATSYYAQKTITTKTTTTKTAPKYEVRLKNTTTPPVPEPRTNKHVQNFRSESRNVDNQGVVLDTLAALVKDCNATAEILRSRSSSRTNLNDDGRQSRLIYNLKEEDFRPKSQLFSECYQKTTTTRRSVTPPSRDYGRGKYLAGAVKVLPDEATKAPLQQDIQYTLRLQSPIYKSGVADFSTRQKYTLHDRTPSLEKVCRDFNLESPRPRSVSHPRSETPESRRVIVLEDQKERDAPICAACNHAIYGPCITALAPNSKHGAQKYHPRHFVCTYCLKPLNLKGTYREHESKPYCHECFYRLFSGHVYVTENKISLDLQ